MLPSRYLPLPEWESETDTWNHVSLDSHTGERSLAPFPIDLSPGLYTKRADADTIVYTNHTDWRAHIRPGSSALGCRKLHLHGRLGANSLIIQPPCKTWTCEGCAIQHVVRHLAWLYKKLSERGAIRLIWLPTPLSDTESRALRRTADSADPSKPAWYVRLPLTRGRGLLIGVYGSPGGTLGRAASAWIDPMDAFGVFRSELRLPERLELSGNYAPSYPQGGGPPQQQHNTLVRYAAGLTGNQSEAFKTEAERLARLRYQKPYDDLDATQMDDVGHDACTHAFQQPR